jgi:hypothetical protein
VSKGKSAIADAIRPAPSLNFASWNQMTQWLRELDALRLVA